VSVPFRLVGADAPWVLQNIGARQAYEEKVIRPSIRTGVREAASFFTAQEAYALKRDSLAILMHERVGEHIRRLFDQYPAFEGSAFEIYDVMLRDVVLPDKVKRAIEEKLEADQQAQKMEFVLLREAKEAERKRIEAQGIKDFQDIVRQGIDEKLLVWKGIEATEKLAASSNTKMVFFNGEKGGLPLVLTADGNAEK
jgi:regulator of protease activity HflC (stomatin/prohibitin superfamily)